MGLATIGFWVGYVLSAMGLLALAVSFALRSKRAVKNSACCLFVAVAFLVFWRVLVPQVRTTLIHALNDGQSAWNDRQSDIRYARYHHQAAPAPSPDRAEELRAMEQAQRMARIFGWDWRKLMHEPEEKAEKSGLIEPERLRPRDHESK